MAATLHPVHASGASALPRSSAISAPARKPRSRRSPRKRDCYNAITGHCEAPVRAPWQSPSGKRAPPEGDCFVASLLAMTRGLDCQRALRASQWPGRRSRECALMRQEPALALDAAAIAGERAAGADDTMTGYDDADGIGAIGEADGADRLGAADAPRQLAVGQRGAARDLAQRAPYQALERRAAGRGRQPVDGGEIAGEIGAERAGEPAGIARPLEHETILAVMQAQLAAHAFVVVGPFEGAQIALAVGDDGQFADRRVERVEEQAQWLSHERPPVLRERWTNRRPRDAARHRRATAATARRDRAAWPASAACRPRRRRAAGRYRTRETRRAHAARGAQCNAPSIRRCRGWCAAAPPLPRPCRRAGRAADRPRQPRPAR